MNIFSLAEVHLKFQKFFKKASLVEKFGKIGKTQTGLVHATTPSASVFLTTQVG